MLPEVKEMERDALCKLEDAFLEERLRYTSLDIRTGHAIDCSYYTYIVFEKYRVEQAIKEVRNGTIYLEGARPLACNRYNYSPWMGAGRSEREALLMAVDFGDYYLDWTR